jgi:hypothetical protein
MKTDNSKEMKSPRGGKGDEKNGRRGVKERAAVQKEGRKAESKAGVKATEKKIQSGKASKMR